VPNQGKKSRPTTRRIFTLHYHGQIGYNVTYLGKSNLHSMSNTFGHTHTTSLSHLDSGETHSLSKEWNFRLAQANVRYNESSKILPRFEHFQSHSQSTRFSLFESSHKFLKTWKPIFLIHAYIKTKCFLFLSNFEQKSCSTKKRKLQKIKSF